MKRNVLWLLSVGLLLCACRPASRQRAARAPGSDPEEPRQESVTHWTAKTELFMEFPALVAARQARFAVHFTSLETFKPLKSGQVEVRLRHQDGLQEVFATAGPSRPGIFGVDVQPSKAGTYQMSVALVSAEQSDLHELGAITVYPDAKAASRTDAPAGEETIAFLKEQQWSLEFATETVRERPAREVIRVSAEISPRVGGEAQVTVPFHGRLASSTLPPPGTAVAKGQVLATLIPPTSNPSELPALELAKAEADAALQLARKDRQRAERLLNAGAAPARRLDEARYAEQTAEARVMAATARLEQYRATREAEGEQPSVKTFLLRAPISGLVMETRAVPGANVEAGEVLFGIVDADTVYVAAIVPEVELPRIAQFREAALEIPGQPAIRRLHRLVSVGRLVDPSTRTFRVIYEAANQDRALAINQTVFARLLGPVGGPRPAVPVSAVVDDGGRPVVFVQLEGEAFARRPVKLGESEGVYVQVVEGVKVGERVVSRGAYLIRLSALSSQVPAHGHVH